MAGLFDQLSPRLSRISCWRMGILSMVREISRTSHGNGLRRYIVPSFPIRTSMKPLGCSLRRKAERASGSVSVSTTTSRSARSSNRSVNRAICSMYRGSAGLSAKTTTGLFTQINSSKFSTLLPKRTVLSARSELCPVDCANSAVGKKPAKTKENSTLNLFPMWLDIGRDRGIAKRYLVKVRENFSFNRFYRFGDAG